MQTQETNYELSADFFKEQKEELLRERNQRLRDQLNKLPFRIYSYWVGLTILVCFFNDYILIDEVWAMFGLFQTEQRMFLLGQQLFLMIINSFLLFGCGQMLYGMKRMKAPIAQKGFLCFQYGMMASLVNLCLLLKNQQYKILFMYYTSTDYAILTLVTILPITHVVRGFFVIRVFKKNHPLERKEASDGMNQTSREVFEQYEVIAGEVWKYDKQLSRWPYVAYKWWLTFALTYETKRIRDNAAVLIFFEEGSCLYFYLELCLKFIFAALAVYTMESALNTKRMKDAKISGTLLMVWTLAALILCIFADKEWAFAVASNPSDSDFVEYLKWTADCLVTPVISLLGAFKCYQIIRERDHYAKASSYADDDDTYI